MRMSLVPDAAHSSAYAAIRECRRVQGMKLSDKELLTFIDIWREECGETLSIPQAREAAFRLLRLALLLARTPPAQQSPEAQLYES